MSPADIEVHPKIKLQDANAYDEQQNAFKALCNEFKDIFSVDSIDIGKSILLIVHQSPQTPILFL